MKKGGFRIFKKIGPGNTGPDRVNTQMWRKLLDAECGLCFVHNLGEGGGVGNCDFAESLAV